MSRRRPPFPTALLLALTAALWPAADGIHTQAAVDLLLSSIANWVEDGQYQGADYGAAVAGAGDVNGDGYGDILVGAQKYPVDGLTCGAAMVYHGAPQGVTKPYRRLLSNGVQGSYFGCAVAPAGDVNGDGYADAAVGACHYHAVKGYDGAAYVYHGSPAGLSADPDWVRIGPAGDSEFGTALRSAGDVNGDSYADLLVGAPNFADGQSGEGAIYLFYGSASGLSTEPDWVYQSDQAAARLGQALAPLGDVNRDGYADFAVGARGYDQGKADNGAVFVFFGSSGGPGPVPDWSAYGEQSGDSFGFALDGAGDVDGNGYPDLLAGAPGYSDGEILEDFGAVYLFYASAAGLSPTPAWKITGSQNYSGFADAVAGLGDANQDGFADIGVGAWRLNGDQPAEGFAFVYRGGPTGLSSAVSWSAEGDKAEAGFGFALAGAGDVNHDGRADLIVGAPLYKRDQKTVMGQAYVYHGMAIGELPGFKCFIPLVEAGP